MSTNVNPVNPRMARTHALNVEGVFFQRRIADVLHTEGWTIVAEEYPVAFPPGSGPILGKEGRLDIRAEKQISDFVTILAVECKKADPDYKEWVFFRKDLNKIQAAVIIRREKATGGSGRGRWEIPTSIADFTTGSTFYEARELKAEYGKPDSWKTATKRIEEGCYQAAQATQALVREIGIRQGLLLDRQMEPAMTTWVIPMVVTTANLLVCRFDPANVSLETGEIDWNQVSYDPVDAAVLEYPLPPHLQLPPSDPLALRPEEVHRFTKKHVIIVKSTSLGTFVRSADLGSRVD